MAPNCCGGGEVVAGPAGKPNWGIGAEGAVWNLAITDSRALDDVAGTGAGAGESNNPARSFAGWLDWAEGAESSKSMREVSLFLEDL